MPKKVKIKKIPARKREIREIKEKKKEVKGIGKNESGLEKEIIDEGDAVDSGRFLNFIQQGNRNSPVLENVAVATNQRDLEQEVAQAPSPEKEDEKSKLSYGSSGSQSYASMNPKAKSKKERSEYLSGGSGYMASDESKDTNQRNDGNTSEREKPLTEDDFIGMGSQKYDVSKDYE